MRVFWDSETAPTEHGVETPPCVVTAIAVDDGPVMLYPPAEARAHLREYAANGATMVGHATAFDIAVNGLTPADFPNGWCDTQIRGVIRAAASGQHSDAGVSLARLAAPLGVKLGGKGTIQLSFRPGVPLTPEQEEYARQDVVATRAVFFDQGGDRRLPDEARQSRAAWEVWRMARRGVRLDEARVRTLAGEADASLRGLRALLLEAGIIQPRGPKKDPWREEAVDRTAVQARLTATGARRRTSEESDLLAADEEALRASGDPALAVLADYKATEKWRSLVGAFEVGPVARAYWKPMVASGRVSASRPNLTQVPKGPLRECVIPSPGNALVVADYSMLEFRAWADVCERWLGWSRAAEALRAGKDAHSVLAAELGGDRQSAKAGNYGLLGGMGIARLASTYNMSHERAVEVDAAWRRTWPENRQYFRRIKEGALGGGMYRTTLPWSGRERVAFFAEAANFLIQGTGADVAKEALLRAERSWLPVIMLGHDEFVLDVPRADAEGAARELCRCMEEAGREVCPNVPWQQSAKVVDTWG